MRRAIVSAICALLAAAACATVAPTPPKIALADFDRIVGNDWTGTLIYRDYSPPFGDVTIAATIAVTQVDGGLKLAIHYPKEPGEDRTDVMKISADGRMLDGEPVISRSERDDALVIVTEADCKDNDRPARCEHTYALGRSAFGIVKVVKLASGEPPFRRNAYMLRR